MKVESINRHLPTRFEGRDISAAYPFQGFFLIVYAATIDQPLTKVYFSPEGKEVFSVIEE